MESVSKTKKSQATQEENEEKKSWLMPGWFKFAATWYPRRDVMSATEMEDGSLRVSLRNKVIALDGKNVTEFIEWMQS